MLWSGIYLVIPPLVKKYPGYTTVRSFDARWYIYIYTVEPRLSDSRLSVPSIIRNDIQNF